VALGGAPIEVGVSEGDVLLGDLHASGARVRFDVRGDDVIVVGPGGGGEASVGGVALLARTPRIVQPGQAVRLGGVDLHVALEAGSASGVETRELALRAAALAVAAAPPRLRVRVVEGPRMGAALDLLPGRSHVVGRGAACELLLDGEGVSREHCAIEVLEGRVVVRDLGSAQGAFLGSRRLAPRRRAIWEPSRMLRVGDTVLSLEQPVGDDALFASLGATADEPAGAVLEPAARGPHVEGAERSAELEPERSPPPPPAAAPPRGAPRRDPLRALAVAAAVLGLLAVAALVVLLTS
jgi:hypothetical protein